MSWKIPLSDLDYDKAEERAVLRVLRSKWLTCGPEVEAFEAELAAYLGGGHVAMVSSATAGLHLAMVLAGVKRGDEVIVPSLTFVATANAAIYAGAKPIFCDIAGDRDPGLDPRDVARKITDRTRAIVPVHYAGYACDMDSLRAKAKGKTHGSSHKGETRLAVIEDNAHGIGSRTQKGVSLGAAGDFGVFSFFSNKNLAIGEGGAVWSADAEAIARVRRLRGHGLTRPTWRRHSAKTAAENFGAPDYDALELGYNYRPTEIAAALARVQLTKLNAMNETRRKLVTGYEKLFLGVGEVTIPFLGQTRTLSPACHIFPILAPTPKIADSLRAFLAEKGIQTSRHYYPVHWLSYYRKRLAKSPPRLPKTESFSAREVTLPLFSTMREEQVTIVVDAVKQALASR